MATPPSVWTALRELVDQFGLLLGVLIKEEMQLVEGVPAHQPVMLLVQAVEDQAVAEDLVEQPAAHPPRLGCEADGEQPQRVELLDLIPALVEERLAGLRTVGT